MKKKRRPITLIEIMIVILLIGLIGGALAFNMRGSLDEGRAFKTKQTINRIHDILMMKYAEGDKGLEQIKKEWMTIVKESALVKADELLKDGWKGGFTLTVKDDDIDITSAKLIAYEASKTAKGQKQY